MPLYFHRTPKLLQLWDRKALWSMKTNKKEVYLTFDDGPIPEVTPWVLDLLEQYDAKASFFWVGDNVKKFPSVAQLVVDKGHAIGNHTFNHIKSWKIDNASFLENVTLCQDKIEAFSKSRLKETQYFRPPHGKLKRSQTKILRQNNYQIVYWDVLSADFDPMLSAEECLRKTIRATRKGSIIVFHDSVKTIEKLKYVLPKYLDFLSKEGYNYRTL